MLPAQSAHRNKTKRSRRKAHGNKSTEYHISDLTLRTPYSVRDNMCRGVYPDNGSPRGKKFERSHSNFYQKQFSNLVINKIRDDSYHGKGWKIQSYDRTWPLRNGIKPELNIPIDSAL